MTELKTSTASGMVTLEGTGMSDTQRKVLAVDDEPEVLEGLRHILRSVCELETATSGTAALELLERSEEIAVIIADYNMPGMSGADLLAAVRERHPNVVRLVLTGQRDVSVLTEVVNAGHAFRVLLKPCPPDAMRRAVVDALDHHSSVLARERVSGLERYQRGLQQIIAAFVRVVEARDPYTAGHQQRVAELAALICDQLDLSATVTSAVTMAASVHDLGKVYVPAEILNRPGKLTDAEMAIVKLHAHVGAEILEPIEFDRPIAEIVHQHHERLDGGGYPLGLRGDAIHLEARVIGVADIVEAIVSHRPYRPALGMPVALDVLARGKRQGALDGGVVDACMAVVESGLWPTADG